MDKLPKNIRNPFTALGFDYGTLRIGVAVGQSLTGTASPVDIVPAADGIPDWDHVKHLVEQWQPDIFIVGLPYNMDDSESELLVRARKFALRLHGRFHRPWYGMDERLSSFEAREVLSARKSSKDRPLDSVAAQLILESWFRQQTPHQ